MMKVISFFIDFLSRACPIYRKNNFIRIKTLDYFHYLCSEYCVCLNNGTDVNSAIPLLFKTIVL